MSARSSSTDRLSPLDPTGLGFGCTGVGPGCQNFTAPSLPVSGFVMNSGGVVTNPGSGEQAFPFVSTGNADLPDTDYVF